MLRTDGLAPDGTPLAGFGLTPTIGRGNDIVAAARQQAEPLVGRDVETMAVSREPRGQLLERPR